MAFVVYISFLITYGYLKYVDNSVQLFLQELTHIEYFLPHLYSKISKFVMANSSVDTLLYCFQIFY